MSSIDPMLLLAGKQPRKKRVRIKREEPVMAEEDKRSKLVNQFATLASRLGINLPNNVLQSLSQQVTAGATGGGAGSARHSG